MPNVNKFKENNKKLKAKSTPASRKAARLRLKNKVTKAGTRVKKDIASVGKKTTTGLNSLKYRLAGKAGRAKMIAKGYVPRKKK